MRLQPSLATSEHRAFDMDSQHIPETATRRIYRVTIELTAREALVLQSWLVEAQNRMEGTPDFGPLESDLYTSVQDAIERVNDAEEKLG